MLKRILIISNTIDAGGAETFVMKVFRNLDRNEFVFDFIINKLSSTFYLNEINELGGRVYYGVSKSVNPVKSFLSIKNLVNRNKYETVFCIAVHPLGFLDLLAARVGGARRCLIRSTNSQAGGFFSDVIAACSRPLVRLLSDSMFSPSVEAAEWLFGRKHTISGKVRLINNGVDINQFKYDEHLRVSARKKLGISENCIVVGHIGRFNFQKNHEMLLYIFSQLYALNNNSILLLIGEGETKDKIINIANSIGIIDKIVFLGIRQDIPDLLNAFDVMIFPSFYEGMPNAIIEAQATDLPCVISDTISRDVKITDNVYFMSLASDSKKWAEKALSVSKQHRKDVSDVIIKSGYSISTTVNILTAEFEK